MRFRLGIGRHREFPANEADFVGLRRAALSTRAAFVPTHLLHNTFLNRKSLIRKPFLFPNRPHLKDRTGCADGQSHDDQQRSKLLLNRSANKDHDEGRCS